ncbi:hypothetical protein [Streptomyces alboflavus]
MPAGSSAKRERQYDHIKESAETWAADPTGSSLSPAAHRHTHEELS